MLDKLTYINHLNEKIIFGEGNILVDKNDVRDYEWDYSEQYNKVTTFSKKILKKKLPILIFGKDRNTIANRLFEIIDKDVLSNTSGKLYIGDYYIRGYFTNYKKTDYNKSTILKANLTFIAEQSTWINSKSYTFRTWEEEEEEEGRGFSYDFPFDYVSPISTKNFTNLGFMPANFIVDIYGPVENPSLNISGHLYQVNCTLSNNEILTIDSFNKTITKTASNGTKSNQYANRNIESYIFEKIPVGKNSLIVNPITNVNVTLLEERGEPKWT